MTGTSLSQEKSGPHIPATQALNEQLQVFTKRILKLDWKHLFASHIRNQVYRDHP